MMEEEFWKDIKGYEGIYKISSYGRVKSLARFKDNNGGKVPVLEKILKKGIDTNGYVIYGLSKYGIKKTFKAHQLVAIAFLNHTRCGYKMIVDHIDNNKTNNRLDNLQVITQRENSVKDRSGHTSEYPGVCWSEEKKSWTAQIVINKQRVFLGRYKCEIKTHDLYKKALENQELFDGDKRKFRKLLKT